MLGQHLALADQHSLRGVEKGLDLWPTVVQEIVSHLHPGQKLEPVHERRFADRAHGGGGLADPLNVLARGLETCPVELDGDIRKEFGHGLDVLRCLHGELDGVPRPRGPVKLLDHLQCGVRRPVQGPHGVIIPHRLDRRDRPDLPDTGPDPDVPVAADPLVDGVEIHRAEGRVLGKGIGGPQLRPEREAIDGFQPDRGQPPLLGRHLFHHGAISLRDVSRPCRGSAGHGGR